MHFIWLKYSEPYEYYMYYFTFEIFEPVQLFIIEMAKAFDKDDLAVILTDDDRLCDVCDEVFEEADHDKSGTIEYSNLKSIMKTLANKLGIPVPNSDFISNAYIQVDAADEGKLSEEEFAIFTRTLLQDIYDSLE